MDRDLLRSFLHGTFEEYHMPGIVCAVMQDGEPVFEYAEGYADRENSVRADLDTVYPLWSVSKVVTCAAAMQLTERGLLQLDAPISDYIGEFADAHILQKTEDGTSVLIPVREQPKIRNFFTMTAGITYSHDMPAVREAMEQNTHLGTLDFVRALGKSPLFFEPGTHWRYSHCHEVLGGVIEAETGMKFGEYLQENIFDPLGIRDAGFAPEKLPADRLSVLYRYIPDTGTAEPIGRGRFYMGDLPYVEAGGGGLFTSVCSMIRFADALACGKTLLRPETVNLMRQNRLSDAALRDMSWPHLKGYGYGLGVRTMLHPELCHAKSPLGEFGWNGAAGSYILIDPDNRLSAFIGTNMLDIPEPTYQPQFRDTLYEALGIS